MQLRLLESCDRIKADNEGHGCLMKGADRVL